MTDIYCKNNAWYYSDGTEIKFKHHSASSVWKSHDGIIRLIDYDNKNDANKLINELKKVLYEDTERNRQ